MFRLIFCTNLKRVPVFERYVGGGEARALDACLSRFSIISLREILLIEKKLSLTLNLTRLTSIDVPACSLDMMEAVGDVGIQDTASQTMNFLARTGVGRTDRCTGEHQM